MQNLALPKPIPEGIITATVASGAKASSTVDPSALAKGKYLVGVQLVREEVVATTCIAGIYARVLEVVNGGVAIRDRRRVVWSAYIRDGMTPASVPNIRCKDGRQYLLEVWGLSAFVGEKVTAFLTFDDVPSGGTYVHMERPGEGPAQPRVIAVADPAPGADFALQTVPALTLQRIVSLSSPTFTASATVANRNFNVYRSDSAGTITAGYGRERFSSIVTASATKTFAAALGRAYETTTQDQMPLGNIVQPAGHVWQLVVVNLQAADDWGGTMSVLVEEWVKP